MAPESLPITRRRPTGPALALALGVAACQAGPPPRNGVVDGRPAPVLALEETRFAEEAHALLREGKASPERSGRLAAVVRRQLEHAGALFARGEDVRGSEAVVGALYLLRAGEVSGSLLDASSRAALDGALRRFGARGDEGRTLALLALERTRLTKGSAEARELERRALALHRWEDDTRSRGPMQAAAEAQRQAVARALLEGSEASLADAVRAVGRWVDQAVAINVRYQESHQLPERDEAIAAFRCLQTGAYVMAALYLRQGRASDAVDAIEKSAASRIAKPAFFARLQAAAEGGAEEWRQLARELGEAGAAMDPEEGPLDEDVLDAALWGVALEAYRRDPSSLAVAHLLARQLVRHELAEVSPLVLADALGPSPMPATLNAALELVSDALTGDERTIETSEARRVFAASQRLLALGDDARYRGQLETSAARVRQRMALLELRDGTPEAARDLLVAAQRVEPSVWGLTMLGTLERQLGDARAALAAALRATQLGPAGLPDVEVANAHLLVFELARDAGSEDRARAALDEALKTTLEVRRLAGRSELAVRAETTLARILDGYGARDHADRAMARALELAEGHRNALPSTVLSAIARALTQRDLASARAALGHGIKADIDRDALVYGAIWVGLLERLVGDGPDGKVDRVLADAVNDEGWTMRLARWARGWTTDAELERAATTKGDRVEAEFYAALRVRTSRPSDAEERLRRIAASPRVDLFEVRLARDLLAPKLRLSLPTGVRLP